jgi:predicted transcriptional regulator
LHAKERKKVPKEESTKDKVYRFVCENPGKNTYYMSKKLQMSGGRVRHALTALWKEGLIKFKFERQSPRIRKLSYPVDFVNLLPKPLKKEIKKLQV